MEIFNEVKQKDDKEKQKFVHRNLAEVQRCKLEKLMKNPVSFKSFLCVFYIQIFKSTNPQLRFNFSGKAYDYP